MGGAQTVITAPTIDELQAEVEKWYADAADKGLEDARVPWDPDHAHETGDGYEFLVWAHS